MSRHTTKDGPDLLDPVLQHRAVAEKSGRLWYSSLGIAANFILNWYQDLWKIPSKPGGKLDGLAISFILLQVFVGIPLVCPYQKLSWPPTSEVNGTPCPLRPGSNLGSRASFHRKLDFASQTSARLAAFSIERWEVFVDRAALRV